MDFQNQKLEKVDIDGQTENNSAPAVNEKEKNLIDFMFIWFLFNFV